MAFRTSFRPRIKTSQPSFSRPKVASTPKVSVPAKAVQPKTKTIIVNRPAPGYNTNNNQGIGSSLAQGAAQGVGAGVGYGVFVDRKEGYKIALAAGQLLPRHEYGETLYSESYV